jgi:hypothetical protein
MWPFWKMQDSTPEGRTVTEPKVEY